MALDVKPKELRQLHVASGREADLTHLKRLRSSRDFDLLSKAYVMSAKIRGMYHDFVAQKDKLQVLHHPFREPKQTGRKNRKNEPLFGLTNSDFYLINIIIADAVAARTLNARIARWAENIRKVRRAAAGDLRELPNEATVDEAINAAIARARVADIPARSKWVDLGIHVGVGVGAGVLAGLMFHGWDTGIGLEDGLTHGVIAAGIAHFGLDEAMGRRIADLRLRDMAVAGAGQLSASWKTE